MSFNIFKTSTRFFAVLLSCFFISSAIADDRYELRGNTVQGGVLFGKTLPGSQVKLDGRKIMLSDVGQFVLGFGRDNKNKAKLEITFPNGDVVSRVINVDSREYNIQRIDGLPKRKVTPMGKKTLERIRKENREVADARKLRDERTDYAEGFIWPVKGRISGVYGSQRVLNGKPRRPHFGIDIARPTGTPVKAPAGGVVTLAHPDMFFSGGTMIIDHGHGFSSAFLHLDEMLVPVGAVVKQGDCVATVGATGRVTGPHLDWRMNWLDQRVDPALLVPAMPKSFDKSDDRCERK